MANSCVVVASELRNLPSSSGDHAASAVLLFLAVAVIACQFIEPLGIDPASMGTLAIFCSALGAAALFYRHVRIVENFSVMCIALGQVILFTALGALLSYLLARNGGSLWDARLASWDRAIGFDWLAYVQWVDRSAAATAWLRLAYASLIPQVIVLVLTLGFTHRLCELRTVMLSAMIAGTVTVVLSALFPAVGNFVHLGLSAHDFVHVDPFAGDVHMRDFSALRDGTAQTVRLDAMQGIVTFPSYHAALSVVTLWGFLVARLAWIRWPGAALALSTIIATPVDGGHYLVDILAGALIAAMAIAWSKRAIRWVPAASQFTAWPFRRSRAASAQ